MCIPNISSTYIILTCSLLLGTASACMTNTSDAPIHALPQRASTDRSPKQTQEATTSSDRTPKDTTKHTKNTPAPISYLHKPLKQRTCKRTKTLHKRRKEPDQRQPRLNLNVEQDLLREASHTTGSWRRHKSMLNIPPADPQHDKIWLSKHTLKHGTLRVRLHTKSTLDLIVLFRASLDAKSHIIGLGVEFKHNRARFVRVEQGTLKPLGDFEVIHNLAKRKNVDLLISALGENLYAQFHDSRTGVEIAVLQAHDTLHGHGHGHAGFMIMHTNHHHKVDTRITQASIRPACHSVLKAPQVKKPPKRFATISQEAAKQLPASTRAFFTQVEELHHKGQTSVVMQTDIVGLEHLFCAHIKPSHTSSEIPFKYLDEDYLLYRNQPPVQHTSKAGFYVDLSYATPTHIAQLLKGWHKAHPRRTRITTIGISHQGRPILAIAIANDLHPNDPRPSVLLNGAHHGDEPSSTSIALDAINELLMAKKGSRIHTWLDQAVVWVVPQVNPDGTHSFFEQSWRMGRKNGSRHNRDRARPLREGVDLNRNYPFRFASLGEHGSSSMPDHDKYRGPMAASEPETRAMIALAKQEHFAASISYHSGTVCILATYTIDKVLDPRPNEAWLIAKELSGAMPEHPEKRAFRLKRNLYPVDGTDQDWLRAHFGTVALLVEATRRTPRDACTRQRIIEANRHSWKFLLARLLEGPSILAHVVDPQGRPVANAKVEMLYQTLRANEHWTTRTRDGAFTRFVPKAGTYKVRISAPGRTPWIHTLRVGKKPKRVTITLPKKDDSMPGP